MVPVNLHVQFPLGVWHHGLHVLKGNCMARLSMATLTIVTLLLLMTLVIGVSEMPTDYGYTVSKD